MWFGQNAGTQQGNLQRADCETMGQKFMGQQKGRVGNHRHSAWINVRASLPLGGLVWCSDAQTYRVSTLLWHRQPAWLAKHREAIS